MAISTFVILRLRKKLFDFDFTKTALASVTKIFMFTVAILTGHGLKIILKQLNLFVLFTYWNNFRKFISCCAQDARSLGCHLVLFFIYFHQHLLLDSDVLHVSDLQETRHQLIQRLGQQNWLHGEHSQRRISGWNRHFRLSSNFLSKIVQVLIIMSIFSNFFIDNKS